MAVVESHEGERRQITVLFCDLMDSTSLAHRLDPEDFHDVISAYQQTVAREVGELGGHVGQYLGDGVLVYFGYPTAREDDALRAVNAAVRIRGSLAALEREIGERVPEVAGLPIKLRFGIYTGPVVLSPTATGGQEPQALGDTVNLASRLQTSAGVNEILVSDTTHRLLGDAFVTEMVDLHSVKGIAGTVTAWRVLQAATSRQRHDAVRPAERSLLVGRASELSGLMARWERARRGQGQALLVVGDPGVGKTRLVAALREKLAGESVEWIECHGSALHQNSAFYPVANLLENEVDLRREEQATAQAERIERAIDALGMPVASSMPVVASLLSLSLPAGYPLEAVGPEELRSRTFEWLARWLVGEKGRGPAVVVIEDLHWVDVSTQELLGLLMERIRDRAVLLVMTARADFDPPWPALEKLVVLPLRKSQTEDLIRQFAGAQDLPPEVVEDIAMRTDGVPLFVEELTRSVLEDASDPRKASTKSVPFTIQDLLMARIDRLGASRALAQVASILGREFPLALLAEVSALEPAEVEEKLGAIVEADLVHCQDPERGIYAFKHALIRDVAYQSLLRGSRRDYHARAAGILEARAPGGVEAAAEVIALHCEEGGMIERAIFHYANAARAAMRQSAHVEAASHLRRAIALLPRTPAGRERDQTEFELQMALGPALIAMRGYGDPAAERAFARAQALSRGLDEGPQRTYALYGLSTYYQARADLPASIELAQECLALAERIGDPCARMLGHVRLGLSLYYAGEPARALAHHEAAAALYRPDEHRHLAFVHGQDPGALAAIYGAVELWTLGQPSRARAEGERARRLAEDSGHPHTRAFVAGFSAVLHQMLREPDRVKALAEESIALGEKHGFALWVGLSGALHGWACAMRGEDAPAAVETIRAGFDRLQRIGTVNGLAYFQSLLAEAQSLAGDEDGALASLDSALAFIRSTGITYWQSEVLRLKAGLLERCDPAEAMASFDRALSTARRQGAGSHELRAALSASALLHRLGRNAEARAVLAPVCQRLASQGESRDLAGARALLDALS